MSGGLPKTGDTKIPFVLLVIFSFFQSLDPQLIFLKPSFLLLFLFLFALKPAILF
jgi:hypothetical protein